MCLAQRAWWPIFLLGTLILSARGPAAECGPPITTTEEAIYYFPLIESNLTEMERDLNLANMTAAVCERRVLREIAPQESLIRFLYNQGLLSRLVRSIVTLPILTRIYGYYNDRTISSAQKLQFVRDILKIDLEGDKLAKVNHFFREEYGKSIDEFKTVNELFARQLTTPAVERTLNGAQVDRDYHVIAPCSARTRIFEHVDLDQTFHLADKNVGGQRNQFSLRRLFGQREEDDLSTPVFLQQVQALMAGLERGQATLLELDQLLLRHLLREQFKRAPAMVVSRLAPDDYHHVHMPTPRGEVMGRLQIWSHLCQTEKIGVTVDLMHKLKSFLGATLVAAPAIHIPGAYESVSTIATTSPALRFNPLTENVRDLLVIADEQLGIVPMVIIGAAGVGRNVLSVQAGQRVQMGDNLAHFEFGGSSVVTLLPSPRVTIDPVVAKANQIYFPLDVKKQSWRQMEFWVPMGRPLFRIDHPSSTPY